MKSFRQKIYSKKKTISLAGKYLKDHPLIPISTASLGVGIANYATNTKRRKEGINQHKDQIKVLKDLNANISKNNDALISVQNALKLNADKLVSIKDSNSNKENNSNKELPKKSLKFIKFRKSFSIQDGGYKGQKVSPKKSSIGTGVGLGAVIGGGLGISSSSSNPVADTTTCIAISTILGAGVGALAVWLNNIAKESIFNSGLSTNANSYTLIKKLESIYAPKSEESVEDSVTTVSSKNNVTHTRTVKTSPTKSSISPVGILFSIDNDPKKHVINVLLRGNVMSILVNKPSSVELMKINKLLDKYCSSYKLADYSATKLETNIYLVEVNIVNNAEVSLVQSIINSGLKVNILTTDRFGIKNI